jgi:hypothetical protein
MSRIELPIRAKIALSREKGYCYYLIPLTDEYANFIDNTAGDPKTVYSVAGLTFKEQEIIYPLRGETDAKYIERILMVHHEVSRTGIPIPLGYDPKTNTCDAKELKHNNLAYDTCEQSDPQKLKDWYYGRIGNPKRVLVVKHKLKKASYGFVITS